MNKNIYHSTLYGTLLILIGLVISSGTIKTQTKKLPSLKGKKVLLVYGGWKGHHPEKFAEKMSHWLENQQAIVTISDSLGIYSNKKIMDDTDLIIQSWTMDKLTEEQAKGLFSAVKNGTGMAGCHGGMGDSFRGNTEYQYMVGGQWVAHPGNQLDYTVNIANIKDPISKGVKDFNIHSEQYYMLVDPNNEVLATTTFTADHDSWIGGAVMPVAWKKQYGKGRVFYLSVGHNITDLDIPEAWTLLTNGIKWAAASKYAPVENIVDPIYKQ